VTIRIAAPPPSSKPAIALYAAGHCIDNRWLARHVDLAINVGETFVLMGPSGSGKTTTLKLINRLLEPSEGRVEIHGIDSSSLDPAELRRGMGYVLQDGGLFAHQTVRKNIGILPELLGWAEANIRDRVDELLNLVGLSPEEFGDRYPTELSGGQRQRVGIARALAVDPPVVLLDEPFSALDPASRRHLQQEFLSLSRRLKKTFVIVTHDIFEAVLLGDRIGVMNEGALVQSASPGELLRHPSDSFVRSLFGKNRYQLRLMTTCLRDAMNQHFGQPVLEGTLSPTAVELHPDASLWDALDTLENQQADVVHAVGPRGVLCALSRRDLLEATVAA